jgi:pimeloyl-ACP methyl ester carboxylesterase
MSVVRERRYRVGTNTLSGIEACPPSGARGLIVALHGSGYTGRYWDSPHDESGSLLRLGSDLGFRVVAVDRPGYGAARRLGTTSADVDSQAGILGDVIAAIRDESAEVPVFLIGHSFGSLLAVRLAAIEARDYVCGIDVVGLPVQWRPDVTSALEALLDGIATTLVSADSRLAMYFGPDGSYDPRVLELEPTFSQRIPRQEMAGSLASGQLLQKLAPLIRVPVQYTVAEFENSIAGGTDALADGCALFLNAPRVDARIQPNSGHNVSLHKVGRSYHLRALTFFDEIVACQDSTRAQRPVETDPAVIIAAVGSP